MRRSAMWLGGAALAAMLLSGCRVEKSGEEGNERVKVATPFGGVQVRTNGSAAESGMGLPVYPGATPVTTKDGDRDKDSGAADINLNFGSMHLRVKVLSYRTQDAPESVRSFYRKELGRFGTVIACVDERPVGTPTRTPEGLTCDKNKENSKVIEVHDSGTYELKAGSEQHQHTVSIEKDGMGTKFALVMVELPKRFTLSDGDGDDGKRQTQ